MVSEPEVEFGPTLNFQLNFVEFGQIKFIPLVHSLYPVKYDHLWIIYLEIRAIIGSLRQILIQHLNTSEYRRQNSIMTPL